MTYRASKCDCKLITGASEDGWLRCQCVSQGDACVTHKSAQVVRAACGHPSTLTLNTKYIIYILYSISQILCLTAVSLFSDRQLVGADMLNITVCLDCVPCVYPPAARWPGQIHFLHLI